MMQMVLKLLLHDGSTIVRCVTEVKSVSEREDSLTPLQGACPQTYNIPRPSSSALSH
jgi:hypothetical protein